MIVALAFVIPGDHPAKGDSVVPPLVVLALLWVGSLLPLGRRVFNRAGGTRRLLATVVVVPALSVVPFVGYTPQDAWGRRVELLVSLAVWSVTVVVLHLLAVERFRQERRLAEQEQRSRSLFEHNPSPVFSLDLEGRFTSANDRPARSSAPRSASCGGAATTSSSSRTSSRPWRSCSRPPGPRPRRTT